MNLLILGYLSIYFDLFRHFFWQNLLVFLPLKKIVLLTHQFCRFHLYGYLYVEYKWGHPRFG